jgi:hypothetical protein
MSARLIDALLKGAKGYKGENMRAFVWNIQMSLGEHDVDSVENIAFFVCVLCCQCVDGCFGDILSRGDGRTWGRRGDQGERTENKKKRVKA